MLYILYITYIYIYKQCVELYRWGLKEKEQSRAGVEWRGYVERRAVHWIPKKGPRPIHRCRRRHLLLALLALCCHKQNRYCIWHGLHHLVIASDSRQKRVRGTGRRATTTDDQRERESGRSCDWKRAPSDLCKVCVPLGCFYIRLLPYLFIYFYFFFFGREASAKKKIRPVVIYQQTWVSARSNSKYINEEAKGWQVLLANPLMHPASILASIYVSYSIWGW